jgi:hypothetical protein
VAQLTDADRALLQQAQEQARARMTRRTIDETGKDISEPQGQPELIQPGWYWTGDETVWVIGTSWTQRTVYYQHRCSTGGVLAWEWSMHLHHWKRVHEAVTESGQGFGWRPPRSD